MDLVGLSISPCMSTPSGGRIILPKPGANKTEAHHILDPRMDPSASDAGMASSSPNVDLSDEKQKKSEIQNGRSVDHST